MDVDKIVLTLYLMQAILKYTMLIGVVHRSNIAELLSRFDWNLVSDFYAGRVSLPFQQFKSMFCYFHCTNVLLIPLERKKTYVTATSCTEDICLTYRIAFVLAQEETQFDSCGLGGAVVVQATLGRGSLSDLSPASGCQPRPELSLSPDLWKESETLGTHIAWYGFHRCQHQRTKKRDRADEKAQKRELECFPHRQGAKLIYTSTSSIRYTDFARSSYNNPGNLYPGPNAVWTKSKHTTFYNFAERISFAEHWKMVAESSEFHLTLKRAHRAHFFQLEIRQKSGTY